MNFFEMKILWVLNCNSDYSWSIERGVGVLWLSHTSFVSLNHAFAIVPAILKRTNTTLMSHPHQQYQNELMEIMMAFIVSDNRKGVARRCLISSLLVHLILFFRHKVRRNVALIKELEIQLSRYSDLLCVTDRSESKISET